VQDGGTVAKIKLKYDLDSKVEAALKVWQRKM
jgi:hypothetical protein